MPYASKALWDMIREQQMAPETELDALQDEAPLSRGPSEQYRLQLKKMQRVKLLKQILQQNGYGDLARMTRISRYNPEEDEGEY